MEYGKSLLTAIAAVLTLLLMPPCFLLAVVWAQVKALLELAYCYLEALKALWRMDDAYQAWKQAEKRFKR